MREGKVASRVDEKANSSVCPRQPDGIGGGGRRGKGDSRLHESTIFEELTSLKITPPRGGGVGLDVEPRGPFLLVKTPKSRSSLQPRQHTTPKWIGELLVSTSFSLTPSFEQVVSCWHF
jgi:hypothetical protein